MKINRVQANNQTTFGIKYRNKHAWDKKVLADFENSKLLKELNEKYPQAEVLYTKFSGEDSIANSEIIHTLIMDIKLAKDKLYRWHLSSHNEMFPEKHLGYELKILSLKNIEDASVEKLTPIMKYEIKYKQNPIKAFFNKIFSHNILKF